MGVFGGLAKTPGGKCCVIFDEFDTRFEPQRRKLFLPREMFRSLDQPSTYTSPLQCRQNRQLAYVETIGF